MIQATGQPTFTAEQAAVELGVPARVIRQWRYAGKAMPAGLIRGRGRGGMQAVYLLSELVPHAERYLARERRQHPGARR